MIERKSSGFLQKITDFVMIAFALQINIVFQPYRAVDVLQKREPSYAQF